MAKNTPTWDDVLDAFKEHEVVAAKYMALLRNIATRRTPMEGAVVNPLLERMQSSAVRWMDLHDRWQRSIDKG
jgi:hypothetical protein